jgi:hypothetical protein
MIFIILIEKNLKERPLGLLNFSKEYYMAEDFDELPEEFSPYIQYMLNPFIREC